MSDLVEAWQTWAQEGAAGLLPGDEALLTAGDKLCDIDSWEAWVASDEWAGNTDRIHLNLLPVPYVGSLASAQVFVLLLNPGFGPINYFGEYRVPGFRATLLDCLAQNEASDRRGFYCLDPENSWTGGFRYWHAKLLGVVADLSKITGMSLTEAFTYLRHRIAVVELVPYHSGRFGLPHRVVRQLRSAQLARDFVHETVLPKAARGDATVIITRKAKEWGVEPTDRVIVYRGSEARGAHMGPDTRGGRAILAQLLQSLGMDPSGPER